MSQKHLTPAEIDAFGRELDALRQEVIADLGQRDVDHIRAIIRVTRYAEVGWRSSISGWIRSPSASASRPSPPRRSSRTWKSATT
jgi:hypothetical protein